MPKAALMAWYTRLPATVMTIRYPTGGSATNIEVAAGSYCAKTLADAINTALQAVDPALTCTIGEISGMEARYVVASSGSNFDITAIATRYQSILGTYTASNISTTDSNLNVDPLTYVQPDGIHWSHPSTRFHGVRYRGETGVLTGISGVSGPHARVWTLELTTTAQGPFQTMTFPSSSTRPTDAKDVLDRFQAGARMRVYLNWEGDYTPWTTSNTDGYVDLVCDNPGGLDFPWVDDAGAMRRHRVTIVGVEG